MTARRAGTLAVALVGAGVLLAVLLVTWAASIGPSEVLRGDGPTLAAPTSETTTQPASSSDGEPPPSGEGGNAGLLRVVAIVLNVATAVLAVVLLAQLVRWGVRARRVRRRRLTRLAALGGADFDVIDPGAAVARELLADSQRQRDALAGGTPRNAIVACWHRFELASAAAGVARRDWETPSEHVIRVLDLVAADPMPVSGLAGLYREARFSEHELTEADRTAALEALDAIHRSIGATA